MVEQYKINPLCIGGRDGDTENGRTLSTRPKGEIIPYRARMVQRERERGGGAEADRGTE